MNMHICKKLFAGLCCLSSLLVPISAVVAQYPDDPGDRAKYQQGIKLFNEANAVSETAPLPVRRAAIKKFLDAAEVFRSVGSKAAEANAKNAAANIHDAIGDKPEALQLYIEVADLLGEVHDRESLAITLCNIGTIYHGGGLNSKALEYLNVCLAFHRELRNDRSEATTLGVIGAAYDALGEKQKAINALDESIAIRRRIGDKSGEVTALSNLSLVYESLGENEKALTLLETCLKLARAAGDKRGEAVTLHNIASVYNELGDGDRALDYYTRALDLFAKGAEGPTLNNIGTIYFDRGDITKARQYFYRALPLRIKADDAAGAIETLVNIGFMHTELGDYDQALEFFNRALPMTRRHGNKSAEAETLNNVGYTYAKLGDNSKAAAYFDQALPLRRAVGDRAGEARTLTNLMYYGRAIGNPRLASMYGKQAVNRFQELRSAIRGLDPSVRKKYLASVSDTYRDLANILIEQGRIAEAEEVLGMLKEEEIFTFQRRDDKVARELLQTATLNDGEKAAIVGYDKIAEEITAIGKEYGDLDRERLEYPEGKFPKQARLDELERRRSDAVIAFQKYLEQLKVEFAKTSKDKDVAQIDSSLQETLREMKADRTAVVSTIIGEKRLNIIVTTSTVQRAHSIEIGEGELNKLVAEFRSALTSPASGKPIDPRPAGQKLYDILVKPIEGDLAGAKAETIVWSLDGTLRYLPMAAVWDKDKGYLVQRFSSAVITLASRDRLLKEPVSGERKALGAGVSAATEGFAPLSAVPDELDCIVTDPVTKTVSSRPICTSGVIAGQKLLDEKFNKTSFKAALGRYSVLHLASHFKLVPGNENESFLLLGGGVDRHFTVHDLQGVSLSGVELLALSACNTATPGGEKANGVEIEGFGAVAQIRGARSVMATLWPVADSSTRDLMVDFYRRFGTGTEAKSQSLRQAQLKLMRGSYTGSDGLNPPRADEFTSGPQRVGPYFETDKKAPYSHPYYWAPFIIFGNWR